MEFLSHIGGLDHQRPTFFELVAQDEMVHLLRPAFKFVLTTLATRYPRHLLRVHRWSDEVYALLTLAIERYYLTAMDGTFGESFYGLKRALSRRSRGSDQIGNRDRLLALIVSVAVPFALAKLDDLYERLAGGVEVVGGTEEPRSGPTAAAKRAFVAAYPAAHAAYHGIVLAYHFMYAFGKTRYYSPWLHLIGQEIKRVSRKDMVRKKS